MRRTIPKSDRANALDEATAQVFFQSCQCSGLRLLSMHYLVLLSELWVFTPVACKAQRLPSMDVWKTTHDGDQIAYPRCFEPGDRIARIPAW